MNYKDSIFAPISITASSPDSRSLIMPHQSEAVKCMNSYFKLDKDIPDRAGVVVMPTGSGKTYTSVTWLLKEGVTRGYKIVWLVHRQELVQQTYNEFRKQAPQLKGSGVTSLKILPISSSSNHACMAQASRANIYVCSVASVASRAGYRFIGSMLGIPGKRRVIVVIDEAHHSVSNQYTKVLKRIKALNPNMVLLGLTATPFRMVESEQRKLQKLYHIDDNLRKKKVHRGYVYEVTLSQLITSGFLADPKYQPVETHINGDIEFDLSPEDEIFFEKFGELSERLKSRIGRSSVRNQIIVQTYLKNREKYGKTLVFALDQNHAEKLCDEFKQAGVRSDYVISNRTDSQDVINHFKRNDVDEKQGGKIEVLVNVAIMTEGSDVPDIQTVFLTGVTNSKSKLMQMIGRTLRGEKAGGTKYAYVVAFQDIWDKFKQVLNPGQLEIFTEDPDMEDENAQDEEALPEIAPAEEISNEQTVNKIAEQIDGAGISEYDLYVKLCNLVKVNITSTEKKGFYPVGWYSIIAPSGEDERIFVYDTQIPCYKQISENSGILKNNDSISSEAVINAYFSESPVVPDLMEMDAILDDLRESGEMPPYFELSELEDPRHIAEKMHSQFEKLEDQEEWLKKLYEKSKVLQLITTFPTDRTIQ